MSDQGTEAAKNLNQWKKQQIIKNNPITLLNDPIRYHNHFEESTSLCYQLIRNQSYDEAILQLNKTLDVIDLGGSILQAISPYWKLCIYGNLSMCYQRFVIFNSRLWQIERAHKYCVKTIKELQNFINSEQKLEVKLNLMKRIIKVKFQDCAILSQINQHSEALDLCRANFQLLEAYLTSLLSFIKGLQSIHQQKTVQNIFFLNEVRQFAKSTVESTLMNLKEPIDHKNPQNNLFYFWSCNRSKNEEQITQMFAGKIKDNDCKRSILGVAKNKMQVSQFNIGCIMHIEEYQVAQFTKYPPLEEYLFKQKIHELVIYCSLAFFTLATELRFTETLKNSIVTHESSIIKKYGYEQKSDLYRLSELYHLKSIDMVAKHISISIPYLTHIIRSYEKHYITNKLLPAIQSVSQESIVSVLTRKSDKKTEQLISFRQYLSEQEDEYEFHKFEHKRHLSIDKAPSNSRNDAFKSMLKYSNIQSKNELKAEDKDGGHNQFIQGAKRQNPQKKKKNSSLGKISGKNRKQLKKGEIYQNLKYFSASKIPQDNHEFIGTSQKKKAMFIKLNRKTHKQD